MVLLNDGHRIIEPNNSDSEYILQMIENPRLKRDFFFQASEMDQLLPNLTT